MSALDASLLALCLVVVTVWLETMSRRLDAHSEALLQIKQQLGELDSIKQQLGELDSDQLSLRFDVDDLKAKLEAKS